MLKVDFHPYRIAGEYYNKQKFVGKMEFDSLSAFVDEDVNDAFGVIIDITSPDDDSFFMISMTPEEAEIIADNLRNLAQIARGKEKELQEKQQRENK